MSRAENGKEVHDPQLRFFPSPHLTAAQAAVTRLRTQRLAVGVITRAQLDCLARYKVIVLPEVTRLSKEETDLFTRYVHDGGSLYVSGASGTYTPNGRSEDFQLRECMGLRHMGSLAGDTFYLRPVDAQLRELLRPQQFIGIHGDLQEVAISSFDVETLAFIRRIQGLGFTLREIRGLLNLRGNRLQPCAPVRRRLEEKLVDVRRKLADLQKLEQELLLALRSCNKELRKHPAHCPILRETNAQ